MFQRVINTGIGGHIHSEGQIRKIIHNLINMGDIVINCQMNDIVLEYVGNYLTEMVCFRTDAIGQDFMVFTKVGRETGGLIASVEIGNDTPIENIMPMSDEFLKFRF